MADAKLSALVALAVAPALTDELYIRDVSEAAMDESKRITVANLIDTRLGSLGATCYVVASDAKAETIAYANILETAGYPVWVCDGVADNVQIQAALDALTSGGRVILSEGTFHVAVTVRYNFNYVTLEGQGRTATTLYLVSGSDCTVISGHATVTKTQCKIASLAIDGNKANNAGAIHGMNLSGLTSFYVVDFKSSSCNEDGIFTSYEAGDAAYQNSSLYLERVWLSNNGGFGLECSSCGGVEAHAIYTMLNDKGGVRQIGGESQYCGIISDRDCQNPGVATRYPVQFSSANYCQLNNIYISRDAASENYAMNISSSKYIVGNNITILTLSEDAGHYSLYINGVCTGTTLSNVCIKDEVNLPNRAGIHLSSVSQVSIRGGYSYVKHGTGVIEAGASNNNVIEGIDVSDSSIGLTKVGANTLIRDNPGHIATGDIVTIEKAIDHADLTDDGGATGRIDFDDTIPAGSIIKAVRCDFTEAWNSDNTTTLTMMVGIVGDLDGYSDTADPGDNAFNHLTDLYWGEVNCQDAVVIAAAAPRVTFTEDNDITHIISGAGAQGKVTIYITYMKA